MSLVHVYPVNEGRYHNLDSADCYCEPRVIDEGRDRSGMPARVFVHQRIKRVRGRSEKISVRVLWESARSDVMQHAAVWRQFVLRGVRAQTHGHYPPKG